MPRRNFATKSTATPSGGLRAEIRRPSRHENPEFERQARKLAEARRRRIETYKGPQGLGVGKGGIKKIKKQFERKMREQRVVPVRRRIEATIVKAIPTAPFLRLVHHITQEVSTGPHSLRWQLGALETIKDVAECWLLNLFESANIFTIHAGRVTLMTRDIQAVQRVQMNKFKGEGVYGGYANHQR